MIDVLKTSAADAALWIAARFDVPAIPARKRLAGRRQPRDRVGYEHGLGLLIRSGLGARLPEAARAIGPVLLELAERHLPCDEESTIRISYAGITRYSGIRSPNSIRKALVALSEIGFIKLPKTASRRTPERASALYTLTPFSNQLWELAQAFARQTQVEIATEIELRDRLRKERIRH